MRRIITFEKFILFPLDLTFIFLALMFFIRGDWFGGIFAIIVSLAMGIIGQSLHKNKTAAQLLRGEHLIPDETEQRSRISPIESHLLGKALVQSTIVLTIAMTVLTIHSTSEQWWIVALKAIGVAILFPVISIFFILVFPKFIDGLRGKP
jgi:hypothetical protein